MHDGLGLAARAAVLSTLAFVGASHVNKTSAVGRPPAPYVLCYEDVARPWHCMTMYGVHPTVADNQRLDMIFTTVPTNRDDWALRQCDAMGGRLAIQWLNGGTIKRYLCVGVRHEFV